MYINRDKFVRALEFGRIIWRIHALKRLIERGTDKQSVLKTLNQYDIIDEYPDDKPFPSALFFGYSSEKPIHVVAAFDGIKEKIFVITVYFPDVTHFESDYRERRK
ncbi:MAG: DUF4258 domain-containing protein [Calditrichaeota bacterium]|nr:DUF4258 domain-containing protein [Calditrichota bacterium]